MDNAKVVGWLIVGVAVGVVIGYMWLSSDVQFWQSQYAQCQYQMSSLQQQLVTPAGVNLDVTIASSTLNLSSYIASDGSSTAADVNTTLTIENKDETQTATVVISAVDTVHDEEGFDDASDLLTSYFNFYVASTGKSYLIKDGDYKSGLTLTIPPNTVLSLVIGIDLEQAPSGIFEDNQTYTAQIYVIQPDSQDVEDVDLTILT